MLTLNLAVTLTLTLTLTLTNLVELGHPALDRVLLGRLPAVLHARTDKVAHAKTRSRTRIAGTGASHVHRTCIVACAYLQERVRGVGGVRVGEPIVRALSAARGRRSAVGRGRHLHAGARRYV